jgi:hypothetical protein
MSYEFSLRWVLPEGTTTAQPKLQMRNQFVSDRIGGPPVKEAPWVDVPTVVDPEAYGSKPPEASPPLVRKYITDPSLDEVLADAFKDLGANQKTLQESLGGAKTVIDPASLQPHTPSKHDIVPLTVWRKKGDTPKVRVVSIMYKATSRDAFVAYRFLPDPPMSRTPTYVTDLSTWLAGWEEVRPTFEDIQVNTQWVLREETAQCLPDLRDRIVTVCVTGVGPTRVACFVSGDRPLPASVRSLPSCNAIAGWETPNSSVHISVQDFLSLFVLNPYRIRR